MFIQNNNWFVFVLLISISFSADAITCFSEIQQTTPNKRFIDNGDGTVTDLWTRLMWKQCPEGMESDSANGCTGVEQIHVWSSALQRAPTVNSGTDVLNLGYTDWRVPNIKELESIVERQCVNPSLNSTMFPNISGGVYWSSTPYTSNHLLGPWQLSYDDGTMQTSWQFQAFSAFVRLVRDAQ